MHVALKFIHTFNRTLKFLCSCYLPYLHKYVTSIFANSLSEKTRGYFIIMHKVKRVL